MQKTIADLPPLSETIKKHNISAQKKLGQNFLFDLNLTDKIAKSSGELRAKTVIEIGAGPGGLTRALLANGAKKVIAVEKDIKCIKALEELKTVAGSKLEIIKGDALKIMEEDLKINGNTKIVSNLPYNIATELLLKWLNKIDLFESLTLMFQKEVAERINAKPKTKSYGRLSIISQWLCEINHEFNINPSAFYPPPKVVSSVITLIPRKKPLGEARKDVLEKICKVTFGQRRKMLKTSLKQITENPETALGVSNIEPSKRPEELSVEEFCTLSRAFEYWQLQK